MKRCAFLSMDNLDEFESYDSLLFEPLKRRGWSVREVSWKDDTVNWNKFDAVIIRSPWDYQDDPEAFLETLRSIDQSSALLENSLELVEWNIDKSYLQDLRQKGVEVVPSLWKSSFDETEFEHYFEELGTDEIIIKPTISANADDTFWINRKQQDRYLGQLNTIFSDRAFLVQPFMDNIIREGEFSVFYFKDTYSHTILKTPKTEDFRVQEEHGGSLKSVSNPESNLLASAQHLLETLESTPLYSRMDYVRTDSDTFALMELELIEPSLYFNMDEDSAERFARIFDEHMNQRISMLSK